MSQRPIRFHIHRVVMPTAVLLMTASCSPGTGIEGRITTLQGKGVPHALVIAQAVKPVKGYERVETETDSDGRFTAGGLYPESYYRISISSAPESTPLAYVVSNGFAGPYRAGPKGEIAVIPGPMHVLWARDSSGAIVLADTNEHQFVRKQSGEVRNVLTGQDWACSPKPMGEEDVAAWMGQLPGEGWRIPHGGSWGIARIDGDLSSVGSFSGDWRGGPSSWDPAFDHCFDANHLEIDWKGRPVHKIMFLNGTSGPAAKYILDSSMIVSGVDWMRARDKVTVFVVRP